MAKIRAIVKRSDEIYGHVTAISNTLENLQRTVGGYIEAVEIGPGIVILCDEESKIKGKPFNMAVPNNPNDFFSGDIVVLGTRGEEFDDCPLEFDEWKALVDEIFTVRVNKNRRKHLGMRLKEMQEELIDIQHEVGMSALYLATTSAWGFYSVTGDTDTQADTHTQEEAGGRVENLFLIKPFVNDDSATPGTLTMLNRRFGWEFPISSGEVK